MKRFSRVLPILLSAALLAGSLFLPRFASSAFERYLASSVTEHALIVAGADDAQRVHIALADSEESDVFQRLSGFYRAFSDLSTAVEVPDGDVFSKEEAAALAKELLRSLDSAVAENDLLSVQATLLVGKKDPALSFLFWSCAWFDENGDPSALLCIDDESGQMVAAMLRTGSEGDLVPDTLLDFCRKFYPVEDASVEKQADGSYAVCLTRVQETLAEAYRVPLSFEGGWLYFNVNP